MNKATAKALIEAYTLVQKAHKIIRNRQEKVGDIEFYEFRDAFDDFQYFGDKLEESLNDFKYRVLDAKEIVK